MAVGTVPIQSDPTLLAEIRRYGKFDPTGCYQCGSCTLSCDLVEGVCDLSPPEHSLRSAGTEAAAPGKPGPVGLPRLRRLLGRLPASGGAQDLHAHAAALSQRAVRLDGHRLQVASVHGVVPRFVNLRRGSHAPADSRLPPVVRGDAGCTTLSPRRLGLEHMFPLMTYYTLTVMLLPLLLVVLARLPHLAAHHERRKQRAHSVFQSTWPRRGSTSTSR